MKKLVAFSLALMMLLSVLSVSFASVKNGDIADCIGYWRYKSDDEDMILMIGYFSGQGYSAVISRMYPWDEYGKGLYVARYSITYDKGAVAYYLQSADDIEYRMVYSEGKILLMTMDGKARLFEKIE